MIVTIIIISGLIIGLIFFKNYFLKIKKLEAADFKTKVKLVYGDPVKTFENATLIITSQHIDEISSGLIYDFSLWEEKQYIGLSVIEGEEEDNPPVVLPHQTVYQYKEGTVIWSPLLQ